MSARRRRLSWLVIGILTVVAAGLGLVDPALYDGLVTSGLRPGVVGQDVVSLVVGLALCAGSVVRSPRFELEIVGLGVVGYLAYAYGIYAVERMYNPLYPVYLAVFGSAVWFVALGAMAVAREHAPGASMGRGARHLCAVGALLQPLIFCPLWITVLVPLLQRREQIDSLYSIFVLDLCFVMPAFFLVAVGLLRGHDWSLVLAPAMFVLGAVLIGSLTLAELVKPAYGVELTAPGLAPPLLLTMVFLSSAVVGLRALRLRPDPLAEPTAQTRSRPTAQPAR